MKNLLTFVVVLLFVLSSCKQQEVFKLTAEGLPGGQAYLYDEGRNLLDSIQINEGLLEYTMPVETVEFRILRVGDSSVSFFTENGNFQIVPATEENATPGSTLAIEGPEGTNTITYRDFTVELANVQKPFNEQMQALRELIGEENPTEEQWAEIRKSQSERKVVETGVIREFYEANRDNVVAPQIFSFFRLSDEEFVAEYEAAGDYVKNNERFTHQYNTYKKSLETAVGKQYVDYTMDNSIGETRELSEFMEEDKYLLVDFFASWCGPCIVSLPKIAELEKEYGSKGLNVLSIGTWEKNDRNTMEEAKANNDKAIEEENIYWDSFFDSESVGAEMYGVVGIPTLLLIAPDGTILVRTHSVGDIETKLAELL